MPELNGLYRYGEILSSNYYLLGNTEKPMIDWRVTYVPHPGVMWLRFANALGPEKMDSWFGPNWPPSESREGERVYAVRDPAIMARPFDVTGHPAAWISLTRDQFDPTNFYMSRGVWPDQHGQGLGRFMRGWAETTVKSMGGTSIVIWVSVANAEHLENVIHDDYWDRTGYNWQGNCAYSFMHEIEP